MVRNAIIDKVYYENHKEEIKIKKQEYYKNNKDKIIENQKNYRQKKKEEKQKEIN